MEDERESKKRKAYEVLKRNGTLDIIKAQLQLAVFESMGMDNDRTASKSRPNQKEIGTIQRAFQRDFEFDTLTSLLLHIVFLKYDDKVLLLSICMMRKNRDRQRDSQNDKRYGKTIPNTFNHI